MPGHLEDKLDPQIVTLFAKLAAPGHPAPTTVEERRTAYLGMRPLAGEPEPIRVENSTALGPTGGLPIRVYRPEGTPAGILVFFHGGSFNLGDLDTHDTPIRALTKRANCVTVSVGYRLAPEHPFPAALDDALAAVRWVAANARMLCGEECSVAIGGDSAGGNLATVVARHARDHGSPALVLQLLIYPMTDAKMQTESWRLFEDNPVIPRAMIEQCYAAYVTPYGSRSALGDADVSPVNALDLSRLPPAFIATGACDPLRDEGETYAARLQGAGVPVKLVRYAGMPHGFFQVGGVIDTGRRVIEDAATALRSAFTSHIP